MKIVLSTSTCFGPITFLVRHLIFKKSNDPKTRHMYLSMPLELGQSEFEKAFKWCPKAEVRKLQKPMN